MLRMAKGWGRHYLILFAAAAVCCLTGLGAPGLWDNDEGNNSEAAREMLESGNWVVPTFNYQLRVDKPALLYWLQMGAYQLFSINEFAARFPSALAAMITVFLTYDLARRMADAETGLAAGLMLSTTTLFCASAHFANPDALLNMCTVLTFLLFWRGFTRNTRDWFIPAGVATGLGVLSKGPVGLLLPTAVIVLFLATIRQLGRLWTWEFLFGALAFAAVAIPWYVWVGLETRGEFLAGFLMKHNFGRFLEPMESHSGPLYYYVIAFVLGFAPWSAFLGLTLCHSLRGLKAEIPNRPGPVGQAETETGTLHTARVGTPAGAANLFLCCWIAVYVVFFTLSQTKLPNYILPIYPAAAIATARAFQVYRHGEASLPGWMKAISIGWLAALVVGAEVGWALLIDGRVDLRSLDRHHYLAMAAVALLGFLLCAAMNLIRRQADRQSKSRQLFFLVSLAVVFVCGLALWCGNDLNTYAAPRALALAVRAHQTRPAIRIACYRYFEPSLVFQSRHEVNRLRTEDDVLKCFGTPTRPALETYVIMPADVWEELKTRIAGRPQVLLRHYDLYQHGEVVLISAH